MMLKRRILLAAVAGIIFSNAVIAESILTANDDYPEEMQIGETRYTVEMEDENPSPVMLIIREEETNKIIGTISFDAMGDLNPDTPTIPAADPPGLPNGGQNGGDTPGGTDDWNSPPSSGGTDGGGPAIPPGDQTGNDSDPLDDLGDQIPGNLPGGDCGSGSVDNDYPGSLPVPEPSTVVLSASGLIIIGLLKLRQIKNGSI